MTWLVLWAVILAPPAPALQGSAIIGPTEAIAFDYRDADLATYAVVRFEASWDGQPFDVVTVDAIILPDTLPGYTTYRSVPPFASGTHTVSFRACRVEECGGGSEPFRVRIRRHVSADAREHSSRPA
jgi:hypothetical protein